MNLLDVLPTVDAEAKMTSAPGFKTIEEFDVVRKKYEALMSTLSTSVGTENLSKKTITSIKTKAGKLMETIESGIYEKTADIERNLFKNFLTPVCQERSAFTLSPEKRRIGDSPKTDFRFLKDLAEKFKMVMVPLDYVNKSFVEKLSKDQKEILLKFLDDCYYTDLAPYMLAPIEYYDHWEHLNAKNIDQFSYFPECYQDIKMVLDIQLVSQKNILALSKNNSENIKLIKSSVESLQTKLNSLEARVFKLEKEEVVRQQNLEKELKLAEAEALRKARVNKDPLIFALQANTQYFSQNRTDKIKRNILIGEGVVSDDTIAVANICFGEDFDAVFAHFYGLTHYKQNRKKIEAKLKEIYLEVAK